MTNPKHRGHVLPRPLPLRFYSKVNEHDKEFVVGIDRDGKDLKVKMSLCTLVNPYNGRRAARKARKAARLAALVQ